MWSKLKIIKILIFLFSLTITLSCKEKNHIDKYQITIEKLDKLPDNFYAHRRGRIYFENKYYRIWFNKTITGNIKSIFQIEDMQKHHTLLEVQPAKFYRIDTTESKKIAQIFVELSKKYQFGHINIDRRNKIAFSHKEDVSEQFVKPMNDTVKKEYEKNIDFRLLENGWFEFKNE